MPNTTIGQADLEGVTQTVTPIVEEVGLVLEAVELPGGEPPVLRLIVDRPDGTQGPDLDVVATLSQTVGQALDQGPLSGDTPYDLEVTSPGAGRGLTLPRHWRRNVGRIVNVLPTEGERIHGLLLAADEDGIELEPRVPAPKKGMKEKILDPVRIDYPQIRRGKVDVDATAARALKNLENLDQEA
ncbi:MAG: ribosome maturation factor RimP [Galactobacter sp.]